MSEPLALRPYQEAALTNLWNWFSAGKRDCLVVLPTGAGKSLVIAEWAKLVFDTDPSACILVLTHVRELVQQNAAELVGLWPDAPWGIYSAGLGRRDISAQLLFASIQSIHKKAYKLPRRVDMVLIDEAHMIPRNADTMYGKFLADLRTINPDLKIVGLTATPFRLDSGRLDQGEGALFDGIAHETNVRELFDNGWLSPPVCQHKGKAPRGYRAAMLVPVWCDDTRSVLGLALQRQRDRRQSLRSPAPRPAGQECRYRRSGIPTARRNSSCRSCRQW